MNITQKYFTIMLAIFLLVFVVYGINTYLKTMAEYEKTIGLSQGYNRCLGDQVFQQGVNAVRNNVVNTISRTGQLPVDLPVVSSDGVTRNVTVILVPKK